MHVTAIHLIVHTQCRVQISKVLSCQMSCLLLINTPSWKGDQRCWISEYSPYRCTLVYIVCVIYTVYLCYLLLLLWQAFYRSANTDRLNGRGRAFLSTFLLLSTFLVLSLSISAFLSVLCCSWFHWFFYRLKKHVSFYSSWIYQMLIRYSSKCSNHNQC